MGGGLYIESVGLIKLTWCDVRTLRRGLLLRGGTSQFSSRFFAIPPTRGKRVLPLPLITYALRTLVN